MNKEFYRHILFESKGVEPDAKDRKRINDIISKSAGDLAKAEKLADSMCKKITDENKLQRRYNAAVEILGPDHVVTKKFGSYLGEPVDDIENNITVEDDTANDFTTDISVDDYDTEISIPAENTENNYVIENIEPSEIKSIDEAEKILNEISDLEPKTLDDIIDIIKNVEKVSTYLKNWQSDNSADFENIKNLDWVSILNGSLAKYNISIPRPQESPASQIEAIEEFMIVPLSEWREYDGIIPIERYPQMKTKSYKLCRLEKRSSYNVYPTEIFKLEDQDKVLNEEKAGSNIFVLYYKTKSWIVETFLSRNFFDYRKSYNLHYNNIIAPRFLETGDINDMMLFTPKKYLKYDAASPGASTSIPSEIWKSQNDSIYFCYAVSLFVQKILAKEGINLFKNPQKIKERIFREINVISYDCSKILSDYLKTKYPEFPDFIPDQPKDLGPKDKIYPGWVINSKLTSSKGIAIGPMIYYNDRTAQKWVKNSGRNAWHSQVLNPNWNTRMLYPKYDKGLKILETMIKKAIGPKKWKECSVIESANYHWKTILLPFTVL